ncbi:MAG: hypothetical protein ABF743_10130 [Schleiferilactobacillus perolens]|jgi:site-specific DNA-cytosine methylase|uniref:hypothetical protein n=1 Tax=Schleiferilactobacillus perolens TaxID=100468 RepID=UPI0039ED68C0
MNALELFAGIGGIALAEQMAGINVVELCEFADYPLGAVTTAASLPVSETNGSHTSAKLVKRIVKATQLITESLTER